MVEIIWKVKYGTTNRRKSEWKREQMERWEKWCPWFWQFLWLRDLWDARHRLYNKMHRRMWLWRHQNRQIARRRRRRQNRKIHPVKQRYSLRMRSWLLRTAHCSWMLCSSMRQQTISICRLQTARKMRRHSLIRLKMLWRREWTVLFIFRETKLLPFRSCGIWTRAEFRLSY